jgi:hypothetical protein
MRAQDLAAAMAESADAVVAWARGRHEAERRQQVSLALEWYKALGTALAERLPNGAERAVVWRSAPLAVLATATSSEIKKARLSMLPDAPTAADILQDRRVDWMDRYCDWLLEQNPRSGWSLTLAQPLARDRHGGQPGCR